MSDDKRGKPDRSKIAMNDDLEVHHWTSISVLVGKNYSCLWTRLATQRLRCAKSLNTNAASETR